MISVQAYTNASQVLRNITRRMNKLNSYGQEVIKRTAEKCAEEAKQRLIDSGYDVSGLTKNIVVKQTSKNSYTVGFRDSMSTDERNIMYFLEFGTGIVGMEKPHEAASSVGWEYIINPENLAGNSGYRYPYPTGFNSLGEYVGLEGWYYTDPKTGQLQFTSGLHAVSYMYDTMRKENVNRILQETISELGGIDAN